MGPCALHDRWLSDFPVLVDEIPVLRWRPVAARGISRVGMRPNADQGTDRLAVDGPLAPGHLGARLEGKPPDGAMNDRGAVKVCVAPSVDS